MTLPAHKPPSSARVEVLGLLVLSLSLVCPPTSVPLSLAVPVHFLPLALSLPPSYLPPEMSIHRPVLQDPLGRWTPPWLREGSENLSLLLYPEGKPAIQRMGSRAHPVDLVDDILGLGLWKDRPWI